MLRVRPGSGSEERWRFFGVLGDHQKPNPPPQSRNILRLPIPGANSSECVLRLINKTRQAEHHVSTQALIPPSPTSAKWIDVLGFGEPMIDFSARVSDATFAAFDVERGGRRIIESKERRLVQHRLGSDVEVRPGSSVTNTLCALSRLSEAEEDPLQMAFAGCIGSCSLGNLYTDHLESYGIQTYRCSVNERDEGQTGCVIVLTTPDAQRSFLVSPGEGKFQLTASSKKAIAASKILVIEGYFFAVEGAIDGIHEAIAIAKETQTLVAVTAGSTDTVMSRLEEFWKVLESGVTILLCNQAEAASLLNRDQCCCAREAVELLSRHVPVVAVTDGPNGSYVSVNGQLQTVPPYWMKDPPIDTCGAGDIYAAGLLLGLLRGYNMYEMGQIAARSATAVIAKHGTQLGPKEAEEILQDCKKSRTERVKATA